MTSQGTRPHGATVSHFTGGRGDVDDLGSPGNGSVELKDVSCLYGRRRVVHDVSLEVAPGEHVAIVGANGSGKSTLLRTICGLHRSYEGTISFDGTHVDPRQAIRLCAWVPQRQNPGRFPLRVSELLDSSGDGTAARSAAESLGLGRLTRRPLHTLSGGQLQRAFLARAMGSLAAGATILVADEPSAALDFSGQAEIAAMISGLDATVIVATHDRAVADACDRSFEMAAGRIRAI